jgi:transcriptional regulator with XRE-family HTH domain
MRRRLGITQADVAARMGVTQSRISAIEHARLGATELHTLAACVEALGGDWRSSPTSVTRGSPSLSPAPKQPDPPASHGPANPAAGPDGLPYLPHLGRSADGTRGRRPGPYGNGWPYSNACILPI